VAGSEEVAFAPQFPSPRVERVSPGHLVAIASADGRERIVWRWYDTVVLEDAPEGVRIWEPAHGEVVAQRRSMTTQYEPGSRAYASAGLPGAEWWIAGAVGGFDVDLDAVEQLYTENDLWPAVFGE